MQSLRGKVAVVTGGTTGIGRSVVDRLAGHGAVIVVGSRSQERGRALADVMARRGARLAFVRTDVTRAGDVAALMAFAAQTFGGIDFVFNNAGIEGCPGSIEATAASAVDDVIGTNIKGAFLGMKHAVPHLVARGGGVIVNTASFVGTLVPLPDAFAYGATKAALVSMSRSVAAGLQAKGIKVYSVCPWITDTPMMDRLSGYREVVKRQFASLNPSHQMASPDDVAAVVIALFSGRAGFESGDAVLVDYGGTAQKMLPHTAAPSVVAVSA